MRLHIDYYVHGTTIHNEQKLSTGWCDIALSALGLKQTHEAATVLSMQNYDAIFSSDLLRAKQTAKILFNSQSVKLHSDRRLRECNYGALEGKPSHYVNYSNHIEVAFPDGECLMDVQKRVSDFLSELLQKNMTHVAIVAHRAPQLALEVITNNKSWVDAIAEDWRKVGKWQLGWHYCVEQSMLNQCR